MSWEGKVATMMDKYIKGQEDLTVRENICLAFLKSLGRIVTNCNAEHAYFSVKKARPPVEAYAEAGVISFAPRALWDQAKLGWRGYIATDQINYHETLENKGDVTIIKRSGVIMENLTEAVTDNFATDLYVDGNASGNTMKIHGFESFCGADTTYDSTGADVADLVAKPSDTYFDISTALGVDGSWTTGLATKPNANVATDWPEGSGDSEYDYWSPKLVNWGSTSWGNSGATWALNCVDSLRRTAQWLRLTNGAQAGSNLICIMAGHMMSDFKGVQDSLKQIALPHQKATDLGFPEVLNFEGLGLHTEFAVPVNTAYVWNFSKAELCSLAPKLLFRFGPTWVLEKLAYLYLVGFYGNLRVKSPKYFAKLYPYAVA